MSATAEHQRLSQATKADADWRLWGPYLAARQWGTVREDYSADGDAWSSFPFEQAHTRAYRWGEDGIAGLTDRYGFLALSLACWNGQDDRIKERLFGLTNAQGNHGEDAKEYWWHLDATPTHSFAQYLYRYPQRAFPYGDLVQENAARGLADDEYELSDTGVLDQDRFFDMTVTHAKASPHDVVITIRAANCGPDPAPLDLLPQAVFRNTWSWGRDPRKPSIVVGAGSVEQGQQLQLTHDWLGSYTLSTSGGAKVLLTDNETNTEAAFGSRADQAAHPKDAINNAIVHADRRKLIRSGPGTKAALHWHFDAIAPGAAVEVTLRLSRHDDCPAETATQSRSVRLPLEAAQTLRGAGAVVATRRVEADAFYAAVIPSGTSTEDALIARRAFAGLMWCKQVYRYDVRQWLEGDPVQPPPPSSRQASQPSGRNTAWRNLSLADVISMPDEWEYPCFASWDLAFHCVSIAHIDPAFAKDQLVLMCREWAMHPNGQLAAYEWNFSDVNPPVHAWAAWQVFQLDGGTDHGFLVRVFTKLLLNFGWWVNRKDADDSNLFEGGFLGMDNIGPFDRSQPLPSGQRLEQSDATSWMAFFCLSMLQIAWELARHDPAWDETATKFLEHFLEIADAMEHFGSDRTSLWNEEDSFYYDAIVDAQGRHQQVAVRSMVGLLPIMAVACQPGWVASELPDYSARMAWLLHRRPELTEAVVHSVDPTEVTLSVLTQQRLVRILPRLLDENEFLSPGGLRSLSAAYRGGVTLPLAGQDLQIDYEPAESRSRLFGGNSNWRGPVWFPVNVLITHALRTYAADLGRQLTVEFPTGSGNRVGLGEVADRLEDRLIGLFRVGADGRRPSDPRHLPTGGLWQQHPTFSEYFDGDSGAGIGASHQSGWTSYVAHLICTRRSEW